MRNAIPLAALIGLLASPLSSRADGQADLQALVAKAIKAHGGEANLGKFKAGTSKTKGTVNVAGMSIEFTSTATAQMPAQMTSDTEVEVMGMKIRFLQVFNGDKGWIKLNDKVMDMDKDAVAEAKEQFYTGWLTNVLPLKDQAFKLSSAGETKINGKEAAGLLVTRKDHRDVTFFFDKKTGLLVKSEWRAKDLQNGGQEYTAETFYSDYKDFGGVQRPTKIKQKRDGKDFLDAEMTDYRFHDKLDDSVFAKP